MTPATMASAVPPSQSAISAAGHDQVCAIRQSIAAEGIARASRRIASASRKRTRGPGRRAGTLPTGATSVQRNPGAILTTPVSLIPPTPRSGGYMSRRLEPQDLYAIQLVEDPQITPDGEQIAYVQAEIDRTTYEYHRNIWVTSASGTPGRRFTADDNDTTPRWSPDGQSLAFLRRAAGEVKPKNEDERGHGVGKAQLWVLPADGSPAFSPDGRQIAFTSDRTEERWSCPANDIWILEVASKRLTRLTDETVFAGSPAWSPDGRRLAFTASPRRHEDGYTDLMLAEADRPGTVRRLTEKFAPTFADTCIDDQRAFHGTPHLYWSPDATEIYSQAAGHGTTLIYATPSGGGTPRAVVEGQRRIYGFSVDRKGRRMVLASSDPATPGDLFIHDFGGSESRLTDLNRDLLRQVELVRPEEFTFKGADGWDMQGWIIRPNSGGGRPPAILEIHGGPMAMYGWSFFFEFQLLAAHGYAVVYTNPRGSTGYGRDFSAAVSHDWGGKDFEDIMAGLDAAVARGWIDPERLGVAGGSYGGYMTNWAIGHTNRFKAAVTMRCVSNLASIFGTGDLDWILTIDMMDGVPWKNLDWLMDRSPITYVEKITTPLLILHSNRDLRCPISEGEQMFTALKLLGREVRMVRFEGQSHDLSRSGHPRSRVSRLRHIVGWFISHLRTEVIRPKGELARAGAAGD